MDFSLQMKLYNISKDMQMIVDMGFDDDVTKELLEGYKIVGGQQIDDIVKTMRTLEATNVGLKYEADRIGKIIASNTKKQETLKGMIDKFMQASKNDRIDTEYTKVYYTPSKQVIVDDETLLLEEYLTTKTTVSPDKKKIKEDIEKGIIVEGARIQENKNLQIR